MKNVWVCENTKGEEHHFFASSVAEWRVDVDPARLINKMKKEGFPFNLWLVPAPESEEYRIEYYAPQVEGSVWLGAWLKNKGE